MNYGNFEIDRNLHFSRLLFKGYLTKTQNLNQSKFKFVIGFLRPLYKGLKAEIEL